jgi:hypothetical protein
MDSSSHIIIRYKGVLHKFKKVPQESNENAINRGWYILKELPEHMNLYEKQCRSHIWFNTKYLNIKYRDDNNE